MVRDLLIIRRYIVPFLCLSCLLLILHLLNPYRVSDTINLISQISRLVLTEDSVRATAEHQLTAQTYFELYQHQTLYRDSRCDDVMKSTKVDEKAAWLTLVKDDDLAVVQTVVLGEVLDSLSCVRTRLAAVSFSPTDKVRELLQKAGYTVVELPEITCSGSLGNAGHVASDHVLLHAWNLTQFSKIVYLDSATFPVLSLDDVFRTVEPGGISSPYNAPPGVVDSSLSGKMFGFSPNHHTFLQLLAQFQDRASYSCPRLSNFLGHFFSNSWIKLPHSFQVRNFRDSGHAKSFNMAELTGSSLVWEWTDKPTRQAADNVISPHYTWNDLYNTWWRELYRGLERGDLWHWWHYESHVYRNFLHSDPIKDFRAVDIW